MDVVKQRIDRDVSSFRIFLGSSQPDLTRNPTSIRISLTSQSNEIQFETDNFGRCRFQMFGLIWVRGDFADGSYGSQVDL